MKLEIGAKMTNPFLFGVGTKNKLVHLAPIERL